LDRGRAASFSERPYPVLMLYLFITTADHSANSPEQRASRLSVITLAVQKPKSMELVFFAFGFVMLSSHKLASRRGRAKIQGFLEMIPKPQDHSSRPSVTLLGRLRRDPNDLAARNDFVARYRPQILQWCHRWRVQLVKSDVKQMIRREIRKLEGTE
jgi:hypothetical protein